MLGRVQRTQHSSGHARPPHTARGRQHGSRSRHGDAWLHSSARFTRCRAATPTDEIEESVSSTGLEFGLACAQGPRDTMEDELCIIPELDGYLYAAIFDGHGGDAAATWLHDNLQEYVSAAVSQAPDFESGFQAAFEAADDELLQHLESASEGGKALTGAGATGSVLLIDAEQIAVANVGDSSAILVRNGRQHTLTTAHRVYGEDDTAVSEQQRIERAGGWVSDGRVCDVLAVSRAFGDWEFKGKGTATLLREGILYQWWDQAFADKVNFVADPVIPQPAVSVTAVSEEQKDEFLVVATDGLWDFFNQNDAMKYARAALKGGASAQDVADGLVDRALKRYTADNVAVIVVKFPWAF